ncbi:MAG: DUF4140 domain-containing protein, partial [Pseudomonadota bacterium]
MLHRNGLTLAGLGAATLMIAAAATWTSALAETIDVRAEPVSATVYLRGATVTREVEISVPAGSHTLSIADLPAGVRPETVRLEGEADTDVVLG